MSVTQLAVTVARLASAQHGLVRTDQVPPEEQARLRHLVRRGYIQRVAKGVYAVRGAPESWRQRVWAGVWAIGPDAVVSHASAAVLYGFDGFAEDDAAVIDLTVPRAWRGRMCDIANVHSSSHLPRSDVRRVEGLRVTSPERTILDLARGGSPRPQLERAIDSALSARLTTLVRIVDRSALVTGPARRGLRGLDEVLLDSGGHSVLERMFLRLVRQAGLPAPLRQVVHRHAGHHVARVDFLFPDHDLVVEVSGGRGHSTPSERARDAQRRNDLQRLGRKVLEFTYEQVTRHPERVLQTLRDFLVSNGG